MASDNKLFGIHNEATILSLLSNAKEVGAEVFIWRLIGGKKHLARVKIESLRKSRGDFCIIPLQRKDPAVIDLMAGQAYIDLYIPETALIMRCDIRQSDAPIRYYVKIPNFVAQVERRKSFRLDCHDEADVQISFNKSAAIHRYTNQFFKKNCFDVGSGGFSFLVSKAEMKYFAAKDQVSVIDVQFGDWRTIVNATVTMIREMDPDEYNGLSYKVWRVCCKFTSIDDLSKKNLDKYVFERIKSVLHDINEG